VLDALIGQLDGDVGAGDDGSVFDGEAGFGRGVALGRLEVDTVEPVTGRPMLLLMLL
jgi:hypothetical protein